MADNLKIQQQINAAIAERAKLMRGITKSMRDQLQIQAGLNEAMQGSAVDGIISKMKTFQEESRATLEQSSEAQKKSTSAYEQAAAAMAQADKGLKGTGKRILAFAKNNKVALGSVLLLGSSLKKMRSYGGAVFTRLNGLAKSLGKGVFKIAKGIFSIPLKIFGGLFKMASSGGGGNELAAAYQEVKEVFGSLKDGMGALVIETSKNLGPALMGTGLSSYRVFGNVAERVKAMQQLFTDLGPKAITFAKELGGAGAGKIAIFQKGLGLSSDALKAFADQAKSSGKTLEQQLSEVNNLAQQMGPTFAGSAKMMARQMGEIKKMPQFIQHTTKELAEAVAYSSQLGVEASKLAGVLDKFDTFDSAADSVDTLSQAFGTNLNALDLMQAQTGPERIEMLRKAMRDAGQDAAGFTRSQLKLLATQTNLDEQTAKAVFSLKNQGKSLEDIKKASKDAEKKPLSQAEAMGKLADSIKLLTKSGGSMGDGFFGPLLKGFKRALGMSKPMRDLMIQINIFRRNMYRTGFRLGRAFGKSGIFGKFVAPFTKTISDILGILKKFNKDIANPKISPEQAIKNLFANFKTFREGFFQPGGGGHMFLTMMEDLVTKGVAWFTKHGLPKMIKGLTDFILGIAGFFASEDNTKNKIGAAFQKGMTRGKSMFQPLIDYFNSSKGQAAVKKLGEAIMLLLKGVGEFLNKNSDKILNSMWEFWKSANWSTRLLLMMKMGGGGGMLSAGVFLGKSMLSGLVKGAKGAWQRLWPRSSKNIAADLAKQVKRGDITKKAAKALAKQSGKGTKQALKQALKQQTKGPGMLSRAAKATGRGLRAAGSKVAGAMSKVGPVLKKAGPLLKSGGKVGARLLKTGAKAIPVAGTVLTVALAFKDAYDGVEKYGKQLEGALDAKGRKISSTTAGISGATTGFLGGLAEFPRMFAKLGAAGMNAVSEGSGDSFFGFMSDDKKWEQAKKEAAEGFALIGNDISEWASKTKKKITNAFSKAGKFIKENFTWEKISSVFSRIGEGIKNAAKAAFDFLISPYVKGYNFIKENFSWEKISSIFSSIGEGIKNKAKEWLGWLTSPLEKFKEKAKEAIGARSPSKDAEEIGDFIRQGLDKGMTSIPIFGGLFKMFKGGFDKLKDMALGAMKNIPLIGRLFGGPQAPQPAGAGTMMSGFLDNTSSLLSQLKGKNMQPQAMKDVKKVVGEINSLNKEMADVDGGTLPVALSNFATAAKQNVADMTLKRGNTTVKFGVQISIDAKQLAMELAKTAVDDPSGPKKFIMFNSEQEAAVKDVHTKTEENHKH